MYLCTRKINAVGAIAQMVEQRTENPCVPGSIPGGTTYKESFFGVTLFYIRAIAQLVEQRTDIVYKLALCPRFGSWWHHNVKESFLGVTLFCFHFIHYLCNVFSEKE